VNIKREKKKNTDIGIKRVKQNSIWGGKNILQQRGAEQKKAGGGEGKTWADDWTPRHAPRGHQSSVVHLKRPVGGRGQTAKQGWVEKPNLVALFLREGKK